jgi:hypothetical protein
LTANQASRLRLDPYLEASSYLGTLASRGPCG